jgi:hypothetical protein
VTYPSAEAMGARPVGESAAALPDNGPSGAFFTRKPLDW